LSNPLLVVVSGIVFVVAHRGFPVWASWLGRVLPVKQAADEVRPQSGLAQPQIG
jgi:hypothetical protein